MRGVYPAELFELWERGRAARPPLGAPQGDFTGARGGASGAGFRHMRTFPAALRLFAARAVIQIIRESNQLATDIFVQVATGLAFGALYRDVELRDLPTLFMMLTLGLGLTIALASTRVFGNERVVFWREAAPGSGMDLPRSAYFLAKNLVELPRLLLLTFFLLAGFYPLARPRANFLHNYLVLCFAAAFQVSGYK